MEQKVNTRKRYRYILSGVASGSDKISNFRLIAANNIQSKYKNSVALKVNIPSDLKLKKYSCDPYSTTDDNRTLDELGYDLLIWNTEHGRWDVHNEFKGMNPCDIQLD